MCRTKQKTSTTQLTIILHQYDWVKQNKSSLLLTFLQKIEDII